MITESNTFGYYTSNFNNSTDEYLFINRPSKSDSISKRIEKCCSEILNNFGGLAKVGNKTKAEAEKMALEIAKNYDIDPKLIIKILCLY